MTWKADSFFPKTTKIILFFLKKKKMLKQNLFIIFQKIYDFLNEIQNLKFKINLTG